MESVVEHVDLKKLQKAWKKAEPVTAGAPVDPGDYVAKITDMMVNQSKKGRIQVVTVLSIADGKYKGKEIRKFDGIEESTGMGYFKGYAETLGLEIPDNIEALPEALDDFVSTFTSLLNISVKQNGEYQNITVKGLSEYSIEDLLAANAADDDD